MEEAMHMCEVQHFAYFKVYLKDVVGSPMRKIRIGIKLQNYTMDQIMQLISII